VGLESVKGPDSKVSGPEVSVNVPLAGVAAWAMPQGSAVNMAKKQVILASDLFTGISLFAIDKIVVRPLKYSSSTVSHN
jgi:hypothetical protein